jgi:hypothetical protein
MTKITLTTIAFFLFLTTSVFGQPLSCKIKADKKIYKQGEVPKFTVEIKNSTDTSIYLVNALDGSHRKSRFPYSYFKVEKVADTSYKINLIVGCGNEDGIQMIDFVEVKPGEIFNPYNLPHYFVTNISDDKNFERKGKYKITYYYSTNEPDFKKWIGFDANFKWFDWETKEIMPDIKDYYQKLLIQFAKVLKADLVSNTITIEIKGIDH